MAGERTLGKETRLATHTHTWRAAAGGRGGSWYVLLSGIADLVAEVRPDVRLAVEAGGGLQNHANVGSGEIPFAILNPPMLAAALAGLPPFDRPYPDLRIVAANLTPNHLHFAVDESVSLDSPAEWPKARVPLRIPVDHPGTVDRLAFDALLDGLGITPALVEDWGGKLIPAANYDEQLALFERGEVNTLWQFMGVPSPSIARATTLRPLRFLPLPESYYHRMVPRGFAVGTLDPAWYGAAGNPVVTLTMSTLLGTHAGVPDEIVAAVAATLAEHSDRVAAIHPAAAGLQAARLADCAPESLHPGARAIYEAAGLLPD